MRVNDPGFWDLFGDFVERQRDPKRKEHWEMLFHELDQMADLMSFPSRSRRSAAR